MKIVQAVYVTRDQTSFRDAKLKEAFKVSLQSFMQVLIVLVIKESPLSNLTCWCCYKVRGTSKENTGRRYG